MSQSKPKILILTDFYLPGYKSGGGLRTLVNMVERLSDEFEFVIVTRNHDGWGDFTPYESVRTNEWNSVGKTQIYYFDQQGLSFSKLKKIWREIVPDAIYLNSFFSTLTVKSMLLRRLGQVPKTSLVIAPEGEFSAGALQIKARKKTLFLQLVKRFNWRREIFWKAAATEEKSDIKRVLGEGCEIFVAPNMPPKTIFADYSPDLKPIKNVGEASFIFLSRINRKKNLTFVLEQLKKINGSVRLSVYGARDDESYWKECEILLEQMPPNVIIELCGSIEYEKVVEVLSGYHFFILPTHGENFGHVILEAFAAGCPVLLSDKTPWRELEAKDIGWDISLDDAKKWSVILQRCVDMTPAEFARLSSAARKFAVEWLAAPSIDAANRAVLRRAVR